MGLSPVCLCFGTLGVVTRCFLISWGEVFWGRCWEAGEWCFLLYLFLTFLSFRLCFPPLLSLTLTLFLYISPVSVSAMATQADLPPDRGAEGRGRRGGEGRVPVRVEFMENSLTYIDRLLLKKHRRYTERQCTCTTHTYFKACRCFCHRVQATGTILIMPDNILYLFSSKTCYSF